MPTLVGSNTFGFNDGNTGHSCNLGSGPNAGEWDVLCVNSDTVVSTPSGFTAAESAVANQGAYVFTREAAGGEGSTVTVTTSGNFNCQVSWSRWSGLDTLDTTTSTQANASVGGSTPAHSTGTLAATDELVIAFAALHSIQTANQTSPVWSTGYTAITNVAQSAGASGVRGLVAYKTGAGTAAETPSVSWTGDGCFDRYLLAVTFTTVDETPPEVPAVAARSTPTVTARRTSTAAAAHGSGTWTSTVAATGAEQWTRYPGTDNYPSESLYPSAG